MPADLRNRFHTIALLATVGLLVGVVANIEESCLLQRVKHGAAEAANCSGEQTQKLELATVSDAIHKAFGLLRIRISRPQMPSDTATKKALIVAAAVVLLCMLTLLMICAADYVLEGGGAAMSQRGEAQHRERRDARSITSSTSKRSYPGTPVEQPPPSFSSSRYLCPDLAVPEDCECSLVVPTLDIGCLQVTGPPSSDDSVENDGVVVLSVNFGPVGEGFPGPSGTDHLVLASESGEAIFASCYQAAKDEDTSAPRLTFQNFAGDTFGDLQAHAQAARNYSITVVGGRRIFLRKDSDGSITMLDEQGERLSIATMRSLGGVFVRMVTVDPGIDAGLVVLALLGVDWLDVLERMEGDQAQFDQRTPSATPVSLPRFPRSSMPPVVLHKPDMVATLGGVSVVPPPQAREVMWPRTPPVELKPVAVVCGETTYVRAPRPGHWEQVINRYNSAPGLQKPPGINVTASIHSSSMTSSTHPSVLAGSRY